MDSQQGQKDISLTIIEMSDADSLPKGNYLLTYESLRKQQHLGYQRPDPNYNSPELSDVFDTLGQANFSQFKTDLMSPQLNAWKGTFVAYYGGVLCGHHSDRDLLYETANRLYGESPFNVRMLAVFKVPTQEPLLGSKGLNLLEDALGVFP